MWNILIVKYKYISYVNSTLRELGIETWIVNEFIWIIRYFVYFTLLGIRFWSWPILLNE